MREPNRERKSEIKSINALQLNEEQKEAKRLIIENQIVVITGRAGSGKSLVCAQAALDFLKKKQVECIYNTRAAIEVGKSLGFLPGALSEKFDNIIIIPHPRETQDEIDLIHEFGFTISDNIPYLIQATDTSVFVIGGSTGSVFEQFKISAYRNRMFHSRFCIIKHIWPK